MIDNYKYKISVITAVYNAESCILSLIESLKNQEDKDFEWVVVDGASTDKTLEILKSVTDLNIKIISEPDFGIYDALNKGIKACSGEYYLVAGADDIFFENAIKDYRKYIKNKIDMITAKVVKGNEIAQAGKGKSWQFGQAAFISNHAVGVLINKSLHSKYGWYSRKYPIAADQLFIQSCVLGHAKIHRIDEVVGEFTLNGLSSYDHVGAVTELFRIQVSLGYNKWLQFFIFFLRLFRLFRLFRK